MEYKGFNGDIEYDCQCKVFYGLFYYDKKIINYEGRTLKEVEQNFKAAVDECLKNDNIKTDKK